MLCLFIFSPLFTSSYCSKSLPSIFYFLMEEEFYHTQEKRKVSLLNPIICIKDNAWLGEGYYFWLSEDDAMFWGVNSKKRTGEYQIYKANLSFEKILDTVFDKEHYFFWVKQIEKAAKNFVKKTGLKPSLKEINDYFREKKIWSDLDGIMFQDISSNPNHFLVNGMQYKKRIQVVVYNEEIISNFAHHFDGVCV